ncbi:MAG: sugar ABC transporter substrate-binding protein [Alphaproteobacteria bacterium]|jgi:ribose transport system substrate-binding protein|uniref:Sugar ABC transporter substrate-binding protein n=1 Tax=Peteryoungia algae TaxID=2919917 RepID=A0ABT0CU86_9HYPH|nr:sugar ABC transporter substrate-binding protein [Rhizobium sp. SSM4.3]MBU2326540.1 sugar ABC transporter substrate-binding protein [Alphaproteobacteria bacterium]MCJ8236742.1 sugar ABC transporter substrate-binding protein [Rhizobium sp. SSM4.3]
MFKTFIKGLATTAGALLLTTAAYADSLKGAIVVMDLTTNAFQIEMADQAVAYGTEIGADVKAYAPEGSFGDYEGQISIIEDLITKKVDFIVLVAGHTTALVPVVDKAMAAGIPVVNMDNRLNTTNVVTFVGVDNGQGGKMAVDYIASKLGGVGKIALIQGETGNPVQILRTKGFELGALVHPGLEVVAQQGAHWTEEEGLKVMEDILQAHPEVDAVFGESDNLAVGAARAAKSAGRDDIIFVGYDGQQGGYAAIKAGDVAATIRMDARKMVQLSIDAAVAYVKNGKSKDGIAPETYINPELVTAAEVDQYIK